MRIDWKSKERREETLQKLAQHIIEKKYIYINANPLAKVLGLHATTGFTSKAAIENYREAESTPPQYFAP
jgi:hypothetical protein